MAPLLQYLFAGNISQIRRYFLLGPIAYFGTIPVLATHSDGRCVHPPSPPPSRSCSASRWTARTPLPAPSSRTRSVAGGDLAFGNTTSDPILHTWSFMCVGDNVGNSLNSIRFESIFCKLIYMSSSDSIWIGGYLCCSVNFLRSAFKFYSFLGMPDGLFTQPHINISRNRSGGFVISWVLFSQPTMYFFKITRFILFLNPGNLLETVFRHFPNVLENRVLSPQVFSDLDRAQALMNGTQSPALHCSFKRMHLGMNGPIFWATLLRGKPRNVRGVKYSDLSSFFDHCFVVKKLDRLVHRPS